MNRLLGIFKRNLTIVLAYALAVLMVIIVSILRPGFGNINHLRSLAIDLAPRGVTCVKADCLHSANL